MKLSYLDFGAVLGVVLILSLSLSAQNSLDSIQTATVTGTAADQNGDPIPNATVVLREVEGNDPLPIITSEADRSSSTRLDQVFSISSA